MEYSPSAWLGALAGAMVAVAIYVPVLRVVARRLREQAGPQTLEERAASEEKFSIVRRLALAINVAFFATAGYWIGLFLGGPRY